jgi:hypothetical protein
MASVILLSQKAFKTFSVLYNEILSISEKISSRPFSAALAA